MPQSPTNQSAEHPDADATVDDVTDTDANADDATKTGATADDSAGDADALGQDRTSDSPSRSPRELRLAKLKRNGWIVAVLVTVWVLVLVWTSGILEHQDQSATLDIAPSVRFEDLCRKIVENEQQLLVERQREMPDLKEIQRLEDAVGKLHVTRFEVNDAMISQVIELSSIETLIIDKGILTDQSISVLTALPKLQHLRLRDSPITDEGLKTLAQCESLWYINLPHANCTSEGVAALAALPRLRQLRLGSPRLGNDVTRAIKTLESLRGLHLIGVAVTDEGLQTIASMPNLESLYLDDSAVTEAGWDWLFNNHSHLHVHVDQQHHDRDPKRHVHHD